MQAFRVSQWGGLTRQFQMSTHCQPPEVGVRYGTRGTPMGIMCVVCLLGPLLPLHQCQCHSCSVNITSCLTPLCSQPTSQPSSSLQGPTIRSMRPDNAWHKSRECDLLPQPPSLHVAPHPLTAIACLMMLPKSAGCRLQRERRSASRMPSRFTRRASTRFRLASIRRRPADASGPLIRLLSLPAVLKPTNAAGLRKELPAVCLHAVTV